MPLLLLLLLVAVAQPAEPQPEYSLESYLRLAAAYGAADASPLGARERRSAAVHEIREWPSAVLRAAVADVQGRKLRASSASPDSVAIDTVEAAVLMHAEAGLLALRESILDAAESHLKASATLFSWSRQAASEVRTQRQSLLKVSKKRLGLDILQYDVRPRIDRGQFSMALAAGALAAGQPITARAYAEDALVAQALALPQRSGPADDPWRSYLFGPPWLAEATFASVRRKALGR